MPDLKLINDLLDPDLCGSIIEEMRRSARLSAPVYGEGAVPRVSELVRRVETAQVPEYYTTSLKDRLMQVRHSLESHFDVELGDVEEPQFLRYQPGDFFVAHQDGNTPLIHDHTRFRKISVVIFLNSMSADAQSGSYTGGSLLLHGAYPDYELRQGIPAVAGSLAAFRSETTHEVTPVVSGERFTIVSWFRAPELT